MLGVKELQGNDKKYCKVRKKVKTVYILKRKDEKIKIRKDITL